MIQFGEIYPNGRKKSHLYSSYLKHTDFGIAPEVYEEELGLIKQTETQNAQNDNTLKQKICSWLKDVDGKIIVADLNLQNPFIRILITEDGFRIVATTTLRTQKANKKKLKSVAEITHLFTPHSPIEDPLKFIGRTDQVTKAINAIAGDGKLIAIGGDRAAGKTSFLQLLKTLLDGNKDILKYYNFDERKIKYERFITIQIDASIQKCNVYTVLTKIVESAHESIESLEKTTNKLKFKLPIFEMESTSTFNQREMSILDTALSVIKSYHQRNTPLAILIDEFDFFENPAELSSLVRQFCSHGVITCIAGSLKSINNLIVGHISLARHIVPINLGPLTEKEFKEIFFFVNMLAEEFLCFDENTIEQIHKISSGLPYYAQLFGYLAVKNVIDLEGSMDSFFDKIRRHGRVTVYVDTLEKILENITDDCSQYENIFQHTCSYLNIDHSIFTKISHGCITYTDEVVMGVIERVKKAKEVNDPVSKFFDIGASSVGISDPIFKQYIFISKVCSERGTGQCLRAI